MAAVVALLRLAVGLWLQNALLPNSFRQVSCLYYAGIGLKLPSAVVLEINLL